MKKFLVFLLALPLGIMSHAQTVVSASRYFAKADKVMEFEKALTAHIAKYHSGEWKWRVYEIQTGPDAGGYHVVEGPKSWSEVDSRGNLGADHMQDWYKNVSPYMTDRYSSGLSEFQADLSTVQVGDFTDKIIITHVYPKQGKMGALQDIIKKATKAWAASNQTVAVYQSVASGPAQYALVYRLKEGLKEMQDGYRKPWKERFEAANGSGTSTAFYESISDASESSWSEILIFKKELSAK